MLEHGDLRLPEDLLAYLKRIPIARDFMLLLAYSLFPRIQAVLDAAPEKDGNDIEKLLKIADAEIMRIAAPEKDKNIEKLLKIADAEIMRMRENAPHLFLAWLSSHPIDEESLPFVTRCFEHCVEHLTEHVQKQVKKHLLEE